ncbi:MAG: hypothetical protein HQK75_03180 [Candidatus Magnetomorum sp.]|nr:hypothetical protein [Candidatus Magnetomorum sp.]
MDDNYQRSQIAIEVRKKFEESLRKHVRRLAGLSHAFSNILMSLDLLTLSCTVLIVEREKDLHLNKEENPQRYTEDSLLYALAELGLDDIKRVRLSLQVLLQKKYIIDTKEGLAATELAFKLAMFFDTIFPNMPGLNLVAYFNQIGEEVLSKRKTLDLAIAQINKTLQIQGVSLIKKSSKNKAQKKGGSADKRAVSPGVKAVKNSTVSQAGKKTVANLPPPGKIQSQPLIKIRQRSQNKGK